jgi:PAS domain S-box-containing protein
MRSDDFKDILRQKASKKLNTSSSEVQAMDRHSVNQLVEELQIHQIELEIQNEELRAAQLISEANKNRYISLFNNAPFGYVILDKTGMITQFNSAFETMVGKQKVNGANPAFADFLMPEDNQIFRARFNALFKQPEDKLSEYTLIGARNREYHIQIRAKMHTRAFYASDSSNNELLLMITDITELKEAKQQLEQSLSDAHLLEKEVRALLKGAHAVLDQTDFETAARKVFDICSDTIGATSGYVALLSDDGEENEVLFLEAGGLPCSVDPELPMPIRGLRETAYRTNSTVYDNDFMNSKWFKYMPKGHVRLENVMFAPLVIDRKTIGIMGLANKNSDFTQEDARLAGGFGELAAIALENSRNRDKRDLAEKKNQNLIAKLEGSLAKVKQLSGLLPICGHCKKIRNDEGYWDQIESYIQKHSEAVFSHGICRDCAKKHYPDYDVYKD